MPIPGVATDGEGLGAEQEVLQGLTRGQPTHSPMYSPPHWEDEEAEPPFLEFDLGPHQSWGQMSSISSRSQLTSQGKMEEVILPQNPQWRNMKGGWSGRDEWLIHLVGGGSWWRFWK